MTIDQIDKKLDYAQKAYTFWCLVKQKYNEYLNIPMTELPKAAFQAYLIIGSTTDAATLLNNVGLRIPGVRGPKKLQSNDITSIIFDYDIDDKELMIVVRKLLSEGQALYSRLYN